MDILLALLAIGVLGCLFLAFLHAGGFRSWKPLTILEQRFPVVALILGFSSADAYDRFTKNVPGQKIVRKVSSARSLLFGIFAILMGVMAVFVVIATLFEVF